MTCRSEPPGGEVAPNPHGSAAPSGVDPAPRDPTDSGLVVSVRRRLARARASGLPDLGAP